MRLAGFGAAGVVVFVVGVVVLPLPEPAPEVPRAFADAEWYPEYFEDINYVMHSELYEPLSSVRVKDAATRHVNVSDGRRHTWQPPSCESCETLEVWVYGGSTTFGLGQRDHHTIPSQLARVAWEDGVRLEVQNRGVGGDTHWESAQRFAWDVAGGNVPDVAVFYDGTNEIMATRFTADAHEPPTVIPEEFWQEYTKRVDLRGPAIPEGAERPHPDEHPASSAEEIGRLIGARYERSRDLSRWVSEAFGVEVAWIWQPTVDQRDPVDGEPRDPGIDWARDRTEGALSAIGGDVIDLSAVLSTVDVPLYYDGIHTNELGAAIVAEELYAQIRPRLLGLLAESTEQMGQ